MTISGIPFMGPIGAARVAYIDGEYVLNPLQEQMADTDLDMVVAGTANAVNMVESEANELEEKTAISTSPQTEPSTLPNWVAYTYSKYKGSFDLCPKL